MAGANLSLPVDRSIDRGIRSPRHLSAIAGLPFRRIQPFMAHPLRPGETLVGASMMGDIMIPSIVNLSRLPMMYAEIGLWVVPLSTLGPDYMQLIVDNAEDIAQDRSMDDGNIGTAVTGAASGPSDQGHESLGLQTRMRAWAGEIGDAGDTQVQARYMPYVSDATHAVARAWYDQEGSLSLRDDDLLNDPPGVGNFIRSATRHGFDVGASSIESLTVNTASSLSQLIEKMMLLSKSEHTYAEYLAAHGINPRKAAGVPQPIMLDQHFMGDMGGGHMAIQGPYQDRDASVDLGISGTNGYDDTFELAGMQVLGSEDFSMITDRHPYGQVGARIKQYRRRNVLIEEPSVLLGTVVYFIEDFDESSYAHHMDMSRMTNPGHWGNRIGGGIDEEDFLAVQSLYTPDGTGPVDGEDSNTEDEQLVFNLLNLYLHGDSYCSAANGQGPTGGTEAFRLRGPGGNLRLVPDSSPALRMSTQLHILSDLVADG